MGKNEKLFERFCFAQASLESSRHIYRREHGPGQVRRFFNTSFTAFELRRYMMNYYYSRGSFTISELIEVSEFSRPTGTNTVLEAVNMGYLEELPDKIDRRRRDFRPTAPMLEAWQNYCNALLANEKFLQSMKLAQTVMVMRELEADKTPQDM